MTKSSRISGSELSHNNGILADLASATPTMWCNPLLTNNLDQCAILVDNRQKVSDAHRNWERYAPVLQKIFPQLSDTDGRISSKLVSITRLAAALGYQAGALGRVLWKLDSNLPVAGSIKARGGIYEVLVHAEALGRKLFPEKLEGNLEFLCSWSAREAFSEYKISVGSTGNLGLSVGLAGRALGFRVDVHMSADAKQWKVDRLCDVGANTIIHNRDYSSAVEEARLSSAADKKCYFVDDESSETLFYGYSTAAIELSEQLNILGIHVDKNRPLFVYLPCGIGGAPGGITFGLKAIFGDAVHCFFVEPVQSASALAVMSDPTGTTKSVYEVGLTNTTEADGMAVATLSAFVERMMDPLLSGIFTVNDDDLFVNLAMAHQHGELRLEPSAAATFGGPRMIINHPAGMSYLAAHGLKNSIKDSTHVLWTTGGSLVPDHQFEQFLRVGGES